MGNARPRIKLLPEKLLLIREYLNVSQSVMAQLLELSKTDRVSEYEDGVREPNLMVTLVYSRLGKVSMTSLVDDDVSANEFRKTAWVRSNLRSQNKMVKVSKAIRKIKSQSLSLAEAVEPDARIQHATWVVDLELSRSYTLVIASPAHCLAILELP